MVQVKNKGKNLLIQYQNFNKWILLDQNEIMNKQQTKFQKIIVQNKSNPIYAQIQTNKQIIKFQTNKYSLKNSTGTIIQYGRKYQKKFQKQLLQNMKEYSKIQSLSKNNISSISTSNFNKLLHIPTKIENLFIYVVLLVFREEYNQRRINKRYEKLLNLINIQKLLQMVFKITLCLVRRININLSIIVQRYSIKLSLNLKNEGTNKYIELFISLLERSYIIRTFNQKEMNQITYIQHIIAKELQELIDD